MLFFFCLLQFSYYIYGFTHILLFSLLTNYTCFTWAYTCFSRTKRRKGIFFRFFKCHFKPLFVERHKKLFTHHQSGHLFPCSNVRRIIFRLLESAALFQGSLFLFGWKRWRRLLAVFSVLFALHSTHLLIGVTQPDLESLWKHSYTFEKSEGKTKVLQPTALIVTMSLRKREFVNSRRKTFFKLIYLYANLEKPLSCHLIPNVVIFFKAESNDFVASFSHRFDFSSQSFPSVDLPFFDQTSTSRITTFTVFVNQVNDSKISQN